MGQGPSGLAPATRVTGRGGGSAYKMSQCESYALERFCTLGGGGVVNDQCPMIRLRFHLRRGFGGREKLWRTSQGPKKRHKPSPKKAMRKQVVRICPHLPAFARVCPGVGGP